MFDDFSKQELAEADKKVDELKNQISVTQQNAIEQQKAVEAEKQALSQAQAQKEQLQKQLSQAQA